MWRSDKINPIILNGPAAEQHWLDVDSKDSGKTKQNLNDSDNIHVVQVANVALAIKKGDQHVINVEIALGIKNLPTPKAFEEVRAMVVLFKDQQIQIGRTESIKNDQNPKFLATFLVPSSNANSQKLQLKIFNEADPQSQDLEKQKLIGTANLNLQNFVQSDTQELQVSLADASAKQRTFIHINCSEYNGGGSNYEIQLAPTGFSNIKSELFTVIEVLKESDWIPVARTEALAVKNDCKFKPLCISSHKFPGEETSRIRFRCYQNSPEREEIGFCEDLLLGSLMSAEDKENTAKRIQKGGEFQGKIKVNYWKKSNQDSFLTYIVNGARLHLILGIDYTCSSVSLHQEKDSENPYVLAIRQIVGMLQYFDYYNQIALYGFGAKLPPYYKTVSQCFALNGNYFQPLVNGGVDRIIQLYRQNLLRVKPHGPSKLSELINMAIQFARSAENQSTNYYVLIVLTDGAIDDYNETLNKVITASSLPLSIVLVGLGHGDFTLLSKLDQDNGGLLTQPVAQGARDQSREQCREEERMSVKEEKGGNTPKTSLREMIDFIDFKQCKIEENKRNYLSQFNLAKKIFAKLPKQFVKYMTEQHIRPNKEKKGIKAAKSEFLAQKIATSRHTDSPKNTPEVEFLKEEKKKFFKSMLALGFDPGTFNHNMQISMKDQNYFLEIYASTLPPRLKQDNPYTANVSFTQQKKFEEQLEKNEKTSNHEIQREIYKRNANQVGKRQRLMQRKAQAPQKTQLNLKHPCLKCQEREICIIYGQCGHLAVCEQCEKSICLLCHQFNGFFYNINDYQL